MDTRGDRPVKNHTATATPATGASIVVVGLGNVGSQLVDHIGRMAGVARVVLVDRDVYEPANLRSQRITARDVGKPKAEAQRRILRALNPSLDVCAVVDDVANVPPGELRASVIVGCLDSLEARLALNDRAWRLGGAPWIDGGVEPEQQLVRVNGYRPGPENPCLECALNETDYANLASRHPCQPRGNTPAPTNGSTSIGALAAALLAVECEKILSGDFERSLINRQIVLDVSHHRHYVTSFRRNPRCRFDHAGWQLAPLRGLAPTDSLADLLAAARHAAHGSGATNLTIEYHPLVRTLHCPSCGCGIERVHLSGRAPLRCPRCHARELIATGFTTVDPIDASSPACVLRRSLRAVGLRPGDVVRVCTGEHENRFVIENELL
jgi:molybdopterin/thiamine biosynthesis adenylyltransferase